MQAQASFRLVSNEFGAPFGGALPGTLQARVVRSAFPPLPFLRKRRRSDAGKYKRRLAAVALADVVGYTRMMGEDEDATVRCWLSVRHDILEPSARLLGGRLANAVGDSALAEFGDVLDALAWSYAVQTAVISRPHVIRKCACAAATRRVMSPCQAVTRTLATVRPWRMIEPRAKVSSARHGRRKSTETLTMRGTT